MKLQQHFGQANEDVRQILISADKIDKRKARIEDLDFDKVEDGHAPAAKPELFTAPIRRLQAGE
jgi:DNA recombination protein RmuC